MNANIFAVKKIPAHNELYPSERRQTFSQTCGSPLAEGGGEAEENGGDRAAQGAQAEGNTGEDRQDQGGHGK